MPKNTAIEKSLFYKPIVWLGIGLVALVLSGCDQERAVDTTRSEAVKPQGNRIKIGPVNFPVIGTPSRVSTRYTNQLSQSLPAGSR